MTPMQGKSLWTNVLVAVLIAVAAFFAGAQWGEHRATSPSMAMTASQSMPPSSSAPTLETGAATSPADSDSDGGDENEEEAPPAVRNTGSLRVIINGQTLTAERIAWLQQFGPVRSGSYWYDP